MPEILATRCGSIDSSKQAWMMAAVIEVVAAAGAQRRHRALVVAVGVAELVLRQLGVMEFRLGEIGHELHLHRLHLQLVEMVADRLGDEAGGDRRAVVMQDRHQPHRIDAAFVDDQRAQLRVAVLLDHEDEIVVGDETVDATNGTGRRARACGRARGRAPRSCGSPRPSPARSSRNRSRRIWWAWPRWPAAAAAPGPWRCRTCGSAAACCRRKARLPRCIWRSGRARCRG